MNRSALLLGEFKSLSVLILYNRTYYLQGAEYFLRS
jgi:hypothetical protein